MHPLGYILSVVLGVCLTAQLSYADLNPEQFGQATKLCESNTGVASVRSNMWNERTVICNNGAVFEKFGEEQ